MARRKRRTNEERASKVYRPSGSRAGDYDISGQLVIRWRPQTEYGGNPEESIDNFLQVVGHSPVKTPTQEGSILSCDVFSTYRNGAPYGDQSFVVVDTVTKEWEKVKYEG